MSWMREKQDPEPHQPTRPTTTPTPHATSTPAPASTAYVERTTSTGGAIIGKSIHVKGELSGSEDLAIEGKVEGKIVLKGHRVTIGSAGQVAAEIVAKSVSVAGQVKGGIRADERVEVAATGSVVGDISAPRVVLVDGAKFKGSIDMDAPASGGRATSAATSAATPIATASKDDEMAYAGGDWKPGPK